MMRILLAVAVLMLAANAQAHPGFARKYQTSCTTCHVSFPKLNAFGEAYRLAGYRMPGGDDAFIKEEPVSLGAEAYERVWPRAVWPSAIPAVLPLSLRFTGALVGDPTHADESGGRRVPVDFRFPAAINLYAGGALSKDITFWLGAHLYRNGGQGELGKAFVQFLDLGERWLRPQLLNLRVGLFVPAYLAFDHHRSLTFATSLVSTANATTGVPSGLGHLHSGGGGGGHGGHGTTASHSPGFALGDAQIGFEVWGLPSSRLEYTLGVTNGSGAQADAFGDGAFDDNFAKDMYGRLRWKIGGLGFDGTVKGAAANQGEPVLRDQKAWVDNSLILGAMAMYGRRTMRLTEIGTRELFDAEGRPVMLGPSEVATVSFETGRDHSNAVTRFGGDAVLNLGDFELSGLFVWGRDTDPLGAGLYVDSMTYMAGLDWVSPWPWLISTARFEAVKFISDAGGPAPRDARGLVLSVTALLRPNVRLQIEGVVDLARDHDVVSRDAIAGVIDALF